MLQIMLIKVFNFFRPLIRDGNNTLNMNRMVHIQSVFCNAP